MTTSNTIAHPPIVPRDEWLVARRQLLEREKELTRQYDALNAQRRRLPMVRIDKPYRFDGPDGQVSLSELFAGRRQLIVYHFMFDPQWDKGCPGCTGLIDAMGDLSLLGQRETTFVMISRAPLAKLQAYKSQKGWSHPWVSSFGSDFNYDFHVTIDDAVVPYFANYRDKAEVERIKGRPARFKGETHGMSVFFQLDGEVFHTYSAFARGVEGLTDAYSLLDLTPYGRQEDFEDSPAGWPQKPTYG
jgi:predicted dithiol-disulfide oxidoreductase (DUF899 family)